MKEVQHVIFYCFKVLISEQALSFQALDVVQLVSLETKHENESLNLAYKLIGDINLLQIRFRLFNVLTS